MANSTRLLVITSLVVLASVSARADRSTDPGPVTTPAAVCPAPGTPPASSAANQAATSASVPQPSAPLPGRAADRPFTPQQVPLTNGWCCDPTTGLWCASETQQSCVNSGGYWTPFFNACVDNCPS